MRCDAGTSLPADASHCPLQGQLSCLFAKWLACNTRRERQQTKAEFARDSCGRSRPSRPPPDRSGCTQDKASDVPISAHCYAVPPVSLVGIVSWGFGRIGKLTDMAAVCCSAMTRPTAQC